MDDDSFDLEPVGRMGRDIAKAAVTMSDDEARYLVDSYYVMQEDRKRADNQVRATEGSEPNSVIKWLAQSSSVLENQIKRALDHYTQNHVMGTWMREIYGIGPVLSAGLLAHIDITKAPTTGHIWRYAGLDPTAIWVSSERSAAWVRENGHTEESVYRAAKEFGRNPVNLLRMATTDSKGKRVRLTATSFAMALSRRPWNTTLKTLCWKIGQSFMKFSLREECFYGQIYRQRKSYEIGRNDSGGNVEAAAKALQRVGKDTDAYKWLSGRYPAGTSFGLSQFPAEDQTQRNAWLAKQEVENPDDGLPMLPPAQIDARARRYTVKLFLSHLHDEWYRREFGTEPPKPYPIAFLGHAHMIEPPVISPKQ